jgi:hypothetical protein
VERFNLTSAPQEFIKNGQINALIMKDGVEALPATVVDEKIVMTKRYPANDEIAKFLDVPKGFLGELPKVVKVRPKKVGSGGKNK